MAATSTQKQLVKLLSIEHGFKKASELSGVPYDVVRQWSVRGKWKVSQSVTQHPVAVAVANTESELADNERKTKLSLSKTYKRMSKDCEELPVRNADKALSVTKGSAILYKWTEKDQQSNTVVNVAILGIDPASVKVDAQTTLDAGAQD